MGRSTSGCSTQFKSPLPKVEVCSPSGEHLEAVHRDLVPIGVLSDLPETIPWVTGGSAPYGDRPLAMGRGAATPLEGAHISFHSRASAEEAASSPGVSRRRILLKQDESPPSTATKVLCERVGGSLQAADQTILLDLLRLPHTELGRAVNYETNIICIHIAGCSEILKSSRRHGLASDHAGSTLTNDQKQIKSENPGQDPEILCPCKTDLSQNGIRSRGHNPENMRR